MKEYIKPEMEVEELDIQDVIATSDPVTNSYEGPVNEVVEKPDDMF